MLKVTFCCRRTCILDSHVMLGHVSYNSPLPRSPEHYISANVLAQHADVRSDTLKCDAATDESFAPQHWLTFIYLDVANSCCARHVSFVVLRASEHTGCDHAVGVKFICVQPLWLLKLEFVI